MDRPSSALLGGHAGGASSFAEGLFSPFLETRRSAAFRAETVSSQAGRSQSSADRPFGNFIIVVSLVLGPSTVFGREAMIL